MLETTLLCTHVKSTLARDVWMVLNVCTVKMIDISKIKELRLGPTLKKKYYQRLSLSIGWETLV